MEQRLLPLVTGRLVKCWGVSESSRQDLLDRSWNGWRHVRTCLTSQSQGWRVAILFVHLCLPRDLLLGTGRFVQGLDRHNAVFVPDEEEGCLQVVVRQKQHFLKVHSISFIVRPPKTSRKEKRLVFPTSRTSLTFLRRTGEGSLFPTPVLVFKTFVICHFNCFMIFTLSFHPSILWNVTCCIFLLTQSSRCI